MPHLPTTVRRATVLALGATLLVAGPASAHPSFRGGEAPVDSLATLTLAMAHGCDSEATGEGAPTTDVSVEVPEWMRIVEVPDQDGWELDLEEADDGRTEVVTWTADGGEEPAPEFDLDVVVEGEVGDERYVSVFQACDDVVYRWVGTPDEPADDPAVRLSLIEADPDSPPPPEPDPEEGTEDADAEAATEPDDTTSDPDETASDPDDGTQADVDPADDADSSDADADPADDPVEDPVDEDEELATDDLAADDDGGVTGWIVGALVLVLLAGVVAWLVTRRGRTAEEG